MLGDDSFDFLEGCCRCACHVPCSRIVLTEVPAGSATTKVTSHEKLVKADVSDEDQMHISQTPSELSKVSALRPSSSNLGSALSLTSRILSLPL